MGEAKTKGVGFTNVRGFTRARFGDEGWDAVVEAMNAEDRNELLAIIPVGWYSLALYARLIRELDRKHGRGDLSLIKELGRYEAEQDLTTIHRVFLRFASPAFIVEKTGEYWKRFHDTGVWVVTRDGQTGQGVSAVLDGWGVVDSALCQELTAYIVRLLELVGGKNVGVDHPKCRARGDPQCVFRGRWGTGTPPRPSSIPPK